LEESLRIRTLFAVLTALITLAPVRAWEDKGHLLVNRAAAEAMPPDTPAFFRNAVAQLEYLGPEPDRWKKGAGASLRAMNNPDHFLDYEYVSGLNLPPSRYDFIQLLMDSGALKKHGLKLDAVGFLPWRIAEQTQALQSMWRDWREAPESTDAEKAAKRQIEHNIISTAGILGHYLADSANPHHTTLHYNGWDTKFAPNPDGYTTSEAESARKRDGFHARFERDFVEKAVTLEDVKAAVAPLKPIDRIFDQAVAYVKESNALVTPLYELEKAGRLSTAGEVDAKAKAFAVSCLATGASRLRDVWAHAMKGIPQSNNGRQPASGTTPPATAPTNAN
jgi:hypothetical protein